MPKRKRITAEEAVANIVQFVEHSGERDNFDEDDLAEVYGDDTVINDVDADQGDHVVVADQNVESSSTESTDESDSEGEEYCRPPRKILIKKRLVNSIDKAFDETCFDPHNFGNVQNDEEATVLIGYFGPKKKATTEKIKWTNKTPEMRRQRACDILPRQPLPASISPLIGNIDTVSDSFFALFSDQLAELIIEHTNVKIENLRN